MGSVVLNSVRKSYGDAHVIKDVSLTIPDGEFCVLVGPSGCGKSTLLRMIAGLEEISGGEVHINERNVTEVEPKLRDIAMVFQSYALYPQMTVRENMGFALKMAKLPKAEISQKVNEAAALLGLEPLLERLPKDLSGGQRQRVAMGRAIVRKPQVFLFDEPLSNLDAKLRERARVWLRELQERLGVTTVYVTHDHEEACALADRVAVVMDGRFHQLDAPQALWSTPRTRQVAQFLKLGTLLDAQWQGSHWQVAGAQWRCLVPPVAPSTAAQGQLLLPHGALALGTAQQDDHLPVQGRVLSQHYRCGQFDTWIDADWGQPVRVHSSERLPAGARVPLRLDMQRLHWFAAVD